MPEPTPVSVSPIAAIKQLERKLALPTETFTDVWAAQHARAFVVAGANTEALVTDFHKAVTKAIAEGQSIQTFRKSFDDIVDRHGWSYKGSRGWRSRTIYETNMRQTFLAAKWERFWQNRKSKPWLRYVGILDDRIRPLHRQWHNTVLLITDPWWDTHYPMNGWGCRCDVEALDDYWLKRLNLRVQPEAPRNPMVTREVHSASGRYFIETPKGVDPGFGYNVGRASAAPTVPPAPLAATSWATLLAPGQTGKPVLTALPVDAPIASSAQDATTPLATIDRVFGKGLTLKDALGISVSIGRAEIDAIAQLADGRDTLTQFLPELLSDAAEVWVGFAEDRETGRVEIRRRYVKLLRIGPDKVIALVADVAGRKFQAFTVLDSSFDGLDRLRSGLRLGYRPPPET